jgi:hypothetical protein
MKTCPRVQCALVLAATLTLLTPQAGTQDEKPAATKSGLPAASVFFDDPDGNVLEYIAMLPDPPRSEPGPVSWREWQADHQEST